MSANEPLVTLHAPTDAALSTLNLPNLYAELKAKADQIASLYTEKEAFKHQMLAAVAEKNKFLSEIKSRRNTAALEHLASKAQPLNPGDPSVKRTKSNHSVLTRNLVTNNCSFSVTVHHPILDFCEALLGDQTNVNTQQNYNKRTNKHNKRYTNTGSKIMFQEVLPYTNKKEVRTYWSFSDKGKCYEMILRLKILTKTKNGEEIRLLASSVEESELETITLPTNPHTNVTSAKVHLLINDGMIILRKCPYGQTEFTYTAQVNLGRVRKEEPTLMPVTLSPSIKAIKTAVTGITSEVSKSSSRSGAAGKVLNPFGGDSAKQANELFCKIAVMFYDRFKKEKIIDERKRKHFIESIPKAPPLTTDEQNLIAKSMKLVEKISSKAKRIAGTATDSVEKFMFRPGEGDTVWGLTVAKIDVSAPTMFAELWLLDTYEKKAAINGTSTSNIREVWYNIDGSRGQQFAISLSLPGGFKDRLFDLWLTWNRLVDDDGRQTFIIAITTVDDYLGATHHDIAGADNTKLASSKGIYIVRELTENTCEWTRAQKGDLNIKAMPGKMVDFFARRELMFANLAQEKFRRNRLEVDTERVSALAATMRERRGKPLMEDQMPVFASCMELLGGGTEEGWKAVSKAASLEYPDTEMSYKYYPPRKGERSMATGRAVGIIDCSAEEVAACQMNFCRNESMRVSIEDGNPARLELKEKARVNEACFATIKKFPFLLDNREFVFRQFWKSEPGKILMAAESIDDEVDYGVKLKKTRGLTRALFLIENLPIRGDVRQCKMTLVQQFDAGGIIPTWVVDKKVPEQLSVVQEFIESFRKDEMVDAAEKRELTTLMRKGWEDEVYSEEEKQLLEKGKATISAFLNDSHLKVLHCDDPLVSIKATHLDNDKLVTGMIETTIDGQMEELAAYDYLKMSRESTKGFVEKGGLEKFVKQVNCHSFYYLSRRDIKVPGFKHREFRTVVIWKKENENKLIVAYDDDDTGAFDDTHPRDERHFVAGSSRTTWLYERLPDVQGIPQTRVKLVARVDVAGNVPSFIMNRLVKNYARSLTNMRKKFDRSLEIDAGRREELTKVLKREKTLYADSELGLEALGKYEDLFAEKPGCERPSRSYRNTDSLLHADMVRGHAWGRTSVKVRGKIEEVAAFFWDFDSRANIEISGDIERTSGDHVNPFANNNNPDSLKMVVRRRVTFGSRHRDRTFTSKMTLHRIDNDTIIVFLSPVEGDKDRIVRSNTLEPKKRNSVLVNVNSKKHAPERRSFGKEKSTVHAKETVTIRIRRLEGGEGKVASKIDYACNLEVGFNTSRKSRRMYVERRLEEIADTAVYFQRLVPLVEYTAEDGQALGHDLLWKAASAKKRVERLNLITEKSKALSELTKKYPWIKAMMASAVEGSVRMNRAVATKLECVSEKEARQIGRNLVPSLMTEQLAEAGVNQWRVQNMAVKELMQNYVWFETMTVVLGKGIVKAAAWGLMARVIVGAVLSVTDLATDLFILKQFWDGGEETLVFRNSQLISLTASIAIQLFMVSVQNNKKGLWFKFKEITIVLVGMKAPWDAYRVAIGHEQEQDTLMDPMTELSLTKCIEMFTESIPGIVIQTSAILTAWESESTTVSLTTYISLLISVLTTGFISSTISYDSDTDPKKRTMLPDFYGFTPDSAKMRASVFILMMTISCVQVLMKSLLVVFLGSVSVKFAWQYLLGDLIFYLFLKTIRGEFHYWLPVDGLLGLLISLIMRIVVKVINDFTALVQFRHPQEVGGIYFTINLFIPSILLLGLSLTSFMTKGAHSISPSTISLLQKLTFALTLTLITSLLLFILSINPSYKKTFLSFETTIQMRKRIFLEGNDTMKSGVFENHKAYYKSYRLKVERWVRLNWFRWEDERPEWFTDHWKVMVPVEFIPVRRNLSELNLEDSEDEWDFRSARESEVSSSRFSQGINFILGKNRNRKISPQEMKIKDIEEDEFYNDTDVDDIVYSIQRINSMNI